MNDNRKYRSTNLQELIAKCSVFEKNNSPICTSSHSRRGKITAFPARCLSLVLVVSVTFAFVNTSPSDNVNKAILLGAFMIATASAMRTAASTTPRRSARLRSVLASVAAKASKPPLSLSVDPLPTTTKRRSTFSSGTTTVSKKGKRAKTKTKTVAKSDNTRKKKNSRRNTKPKHDSSDSTIVKVSYLPRTQEKSILSSNNQVDFVMGIDEAGRGPLAGPVVVAAAIVPMDIEGITDSKKITKEEDREKLYKEITESPKVRWAVAVMDAPFIDKVNILQATMRGMSAAATTLVADAGPPSIIKLGEEKIPIVSTFTIDQKGCYIVTNNSNDEKDSMKNEEPKVAVVTSADKYCALVDGNRIPSDMPCESHFIVKGDSKEYAIAAASILAKVTRDRLMRDYHNLWPNFGLEQHKGYPTVAHMKAVKTFGASPIHRLTFRPLKDMNFDKNGNIVE